MARPRNAPEFQAEQRTYRFNRQLLAEFEHDCARNLSNPKLIMEALVLQWLETKPKERSAIAERHSKRFGITGGEE
jgi:hypothetical protein